jgi:RNase P/RNase MRP subunit p29
VSTNVETLRRLLKTPGAPTTGRVLDADEKSVTVATANGLRIFPRPVGASLLTGDRVRVSGGALLGRLLSNSEPYAAE